MQGLEFHTSCCVWGRSGNLKLYGGRDRSQREGSVVTGDRSAVLSRVLTMGSSVHRAVCPQGC